ISGGVAVTLMGDSLLMLLPPFISRFGDCGSLRRSPVVLQTELSPHALSSFRNEHFVAPGVREFLANNHVERYGTKMLKKRLRAGSIAFGRPRRRGRDLREPFRELCRVEQEAAAVLFHDLAEGSLGVDAGAIERTTASDRAFECSADRDTEAAQPTSVDAGGFEIIAMRPPWRPLLESVADDHQRLD